MTDGIKPVKMTDELSVAFGTFSMKCTCDFCSGRKKWDDNWCTRCAEVKLVLPKWWENDDICDACEAAMKLERPAEEHRP